MRAFVLVAALALGGCETMSWRGFADGVKRSICEANGDHGCVHSAPAPGSPEADPTRRPARTLGGG
ncbi:MAG: hypothetical protein AAFN79_14120 [Pseudomonadota bacterium]